MTTTTTTMFLLKAGALQQKDAQYPIISLGDASHVGYMLDTSGSPDGVFAKVLDAGVVVLQVKRVW